MELSYDPADLETDFFLLNSFLEDKLAPKGK